MVLADAHRSSRRRRSPTTCRRRHGRPGRDGTPLLRRKKREPAAYPCDIPPAGTRPEYTLDLTERNLASHKPRYPRDGLPHAPAPHMSDPRSGAALFLRRTAWARVLARRGQLWRDRLAVDPNRGHRRRTARVAALDAARADRDRSPWFPGRARPGLGSWNLTPRGVAVDRQAGGERRPAVVGLRRYADRGGHRFAVAGRRIPGRPATRRHRSSRPGDRRRAAVRKRRLGTGSGDRWPPGIAESVLHQLANLQQLDVISRTSSFTFKGRSQDAREIGRVLKATFLLEGSVQSDRTRLRITTPAYRRPHRRRCLVHAV